MLLCAVVNCGSRFVVLCVLGGALLTVVYPVRAQVQIAVVLALLAELALERVLQARAT